MHNKEESDAIAFNDARNTVWQMDKEMEILLDGLRNEREAIIGDIREHKKRGVGTDYLLGEMLGIDKAIALLTPDETESQ